MARGSDYVTEARQTTRVLWDAINTLVAMQREWNALDYGTTLDDDVTTFTGENAGLTPAMIGAVVFDTANAVVTEVLNAGHATNLAKLL